MEESLWSVKQKIDFGNNQDIANLLLYLLIIGLKHLDFRRRPAE
jgi:hypothetical protein